MTAAWLAYIPQHIIYDLVRQPSASLIGNAQRLDAVALFADVSGFTPMSEALSVSGKQGAEELTAILNSYFGPMIALIQSYGGSVEKFGGDSMTVLFPYARSQRSAIVRGAMQCALDMQAQMGAYAAISTSAGIFSLQMKAGLAAGSILSTSVGDPAIRLEYIIAGGPIDRCAEAEHHAQAGDVIVDDDLLRDAGAADSIRLGDGLSRLLGLHRRSQPLTVQQRAQVMALPRVSTDLLSQLASYLHPSIVQRLQTGQIGFVNEHRKVSVLFVRFVGFDYDHDPDVTTKLQQYLEEVVRTIQRYDGYLCRVDMGDKGSKYIALFGAPVAHEDDEERALRCALELRALSGMPLSIGITTGSVYCGSVGSELRQEYTVMGDTVNLAARLMQAANAGQILINTTTQHVVAEAFTFEHLAPISVKGKSAPVPIWAVTGVTMPPALALHEPTYTLPMIGREHELALARARIEQVLAGRGQIIGITAEAGMGKSRLATEIIGGGLKQGLTGYGGACQSYGTTSSYLVWRDVWRGMFGLDPATSTETQLRQLAARLAAIDPRLIQRMPLLGIVLNLSIPDNDLTNSLDAQLRAELLRSLLLDCLRAFATRQAAPKASGTLPIVGSPLLLVLEDCHWIDPLSQELLEFIGRNLADLPVLLLTIYRPSDSTQTPLHWAERLPTFTAIPLLELTASEARQMIDMKLRQLWSSDTHIPDQLVEQLAVRAEGNPFYLEELVNFIRDRGIDPQDEHALTELALPDSLRSLILSRIDQRPEDEKTTLKVASVIGRLFKARWLWGSYPQIGEPEDVKAQLRRLSQLDITPLDTPEPELEYIFKHSTIQEVTYESLPFALRATLHEHVGQFVERTYTDSIAQYLDVLAYHYSRSRNTEKQCYYLRRAGDAAKAAYANQAAIDYYQRLLPLLSEAGHSEVLCELGEVLQLVGRWTEAESTYREGLKLAQQVGDQRTQARCQNGLGSLLSNTHSYQEALLWLEQARVSFVELGDPVGVCRSLERASYAYYHQGYYNEALTCSEQQLHIARVHGDQIGISTAIHNIALVYWWGRHDYDGALVYFQQVLDTAATHGYQRGSILAGTDMAGVYVQLGGYQQALKHLHQALGLANDIGYQQAIGFMIGNAGEVYRLQGDYKQAFACYTRSIHIAAELNDWPSILPAITNYATIYMMQRHYSVSQQLFIYAISLGRELNIPYILCECLYRAAHLYSLQGAYVQAYSFNQEAVTSATNVGQQDIQFAAQLLAIRLRLALGEDDTQRAVEALTALLNEWPDDSEQAAIHYELWRLDAGREADRQAAAEVYRSLYARTPNIEYRERFEELTGEVLPAPPPLPPLPEALLGPPVDLKATLAKVGVVLDDVEV